MVGAPKASIAVSKMRSRLVKKSAVRGESLRGSAVWHLPLAQGAILEYRDRVPSQAPGMEPASPSSCISASLSLSLSLSLMNK